MAEEEKPIFIYFGMFIIAVIAVFIQQFVLKFIQENLTDVDLLQKQGLISGIIWWVVVIVVYLGFGMLFDYRHKVGPISITFLLLWIFAILGLVTGQFLYDILSDSSMTVNGEYFIDAFFAKIPESLIPALSGALALTNKEY